jgi:hypothetical protein
MHDDHSIRAKLDGILNLIQEPVYWRQAPVIE